MLAKKAVSSVAVLWFVITAPLTAEDSGSGNSAFIPDRITTGFSGDPARAFTVSWHTDAPVKTPQAFIVKTTAIPSELDQATTVTAVSRQVSLPGNANLIYHEATFKDLKPSTSYMYRVGGNKVWSPWFDFKTADDAGTPFKFIYLGDSQLQIRSMCSRAIRNAFTHAPDAALICYAGDLVNQGHSDRFWEEWNEAVSFIPAIRPTLATPGNHETFGGEDAKTASPATSESTQDVERDVTPVWQAQFTAPENGPDDAETLKEETYYLDYQGVRFISLNTNLYLGATRTTKTSLADAQTNWLRETLQDNPNRWTVVLQHHPLFSFGHDRDLRELRQTLAPLYEEFGVDLVLQGHDHVYARSHKILGGAIAAPDAKAPIYCISVSGPKMYGDKPKFESLMARTLTNHQMYQIIAVNDEGLTFEAYSIDGQLQDAFELEKSGTGSIYKNRAE